jgi:hypothetical protein
MRVATTVYVNTLTYKFLPTSANSPDGVYRGLVNNDKYVLNTKNGNVCARVFKCGNYTIWDRHFWAI